MATGCSFCSIVAGDVAAHFVLDAPNVVAFLDHRPLFAGHTLVLPREHVPTLRDLSDSLRDELFASTQAVAVAVQNSMGAEGSFVAMNNVVSQSVAHLHVHVVPRNRKDGLRGFFWPRVKYADEEEMAVVATAVRDALPSV